MHFTKLKHHIAVLVAALGVAGCNLYTDLDEPTDPTPQTDAGNNAVDTDAGDGGAPCEPSTDLEFCNANGADCDDVTAFDNCGNSRTVNCGTCNDGMCGERQANVCGCPCEIDGTCVADGAVNPDNPCEACVPTADATGWSVRVGQACDSDNLCAASAVCDNSGACVVQSEIDCADQLGECMMGVCDPATGTCSGTAVADGTACGDDGLTCTEDVCQSGSCEHPVQSGFCVADGQCLADGESPTDNPCTTCNASTTPASLDNATAGTSCGPNLVCATAECDGTGNCDTMVDPGSCAIDGACYADGATNPNNLCEVCDAGNSPTSWTQEPDGSICKAPNCRCGTSIFTNEFTCLRPNEEDC